MSRFPPYVPVAKRKAQAQAKLNKLKKKNGTIHPNIIEGKKIATTWWGKSWNHNLEIYADFSNRVGRGRSYVKNGLVIDLQIESGSVKVQVVGSRAKPYNVVVTIGKLPKLSWDRIVREVGGQFESFGDLLAGSFPEALAEVLSNTE